MTTFYVYYYLDDRRKKKLDEKIAGLVKERMASGLKHVIRNSVTSKSSEPQDK